MAMVRRPARAAAAMLAAVLAFPAGPAAAGGLVDAAAVAALIGSNHPDRSAPPPSMSGDLDLMMAWLRSIDPYARLIPAPPAPSAPAGEVDEEPLRLGMQVLDDRGDGPPLLLPLPDGVVAWAGQKKPFRLLAVDSRPTRGVAGVAALAEAAAAGRPLVLEVRDMDAPADTASRRVAVTPRPHREELVETEDVAGWHVVRLYRFVDGATRRRLADALDAAGDKPVLLDLRWATGGHLLEAIDSVSLFMPERRPVTTTVRRGDDEGLTYTSRDDWWRTRGPVTVLTGPYTASSAEVLARALDHWGWATVAGRPTYGKCVFQEDFPLPSGAVLSMTVGRLLDPAGAWCDGRGLTPHIQLTAPVTDLAAQVAELDVALAQKSRVCRETLLEPGTASAERDRLGWGDETGRLRPVVLKRGTRERLCLAPLLPAGAATAVAREMAAATGFAMATEAVDGARRDIVMPPAGAAMPVVPSPPAATVAAEAPPAQQGFGVRIGSFRDPANAARQIDLLRARHGAALAGRKVVSRQVDLGDKGTWVRVSVVRFDDAAGAHAFCESIGYSDCAAQRVCTVPTGGETLPGAC